MIWSDELEGSVEDIIKGIEKYQSRPSEEECGDYEDRGGVWWIRGSREANFLLHKSSVTVFF